VESMLVKCLMERYWDPATKSYAGVYHSGTLLEIATEGKDGKEFPVGIIVFVDNTFASVPVEFIEKES